MLYRPSRHRYMWDAWVYRADDLFHMYYLHMDSQRSPGEGVAHATSADGVHWVERGEVIAKESDAVWLGSGSVWRVGERYLMNFSELRDGRQAIFLAESTDLFRWHRRPGAVTSNERWYDTGPNGRWDCFSPIERAGGGYVGYLTAVPWSTRDRADGVASASIGRVTSDDGVDWRAGAPPVIDWQRTPSSAMSRLAEVASIARIGQAVSLLVTAWGNLGDANGTYSFTADDVDGPFRPATPFRLLSSKRYVMSNFARYVAGSPEPLVHHTSVERSGRPSFAPLKVARVTARGGIELYHWSGNERLKGARRDERLADARLVAYTGSAPECRSGESGLDLRTDSRVLVLLPDVTDGARAIIEADVVVSPAPGGHGGAGFYLRLGDDRACLVLAQTHGQTGFFDIHDPAPLPGPALQDRLFFERDGLARALSQWWVGDDTIEVGLPRDVVSRLRLIVSGSLIELYIDDRLVQAYAMERPWAGVIGLVAETSRVTWTSVTRWVLA